MLFNNLYKCNKILHKTKYVTIYKHNNYVLKKLKIIKKNPNLELQLLNKLDHPNIIKPIYTKTLYNNQYIVTDYYSKGDLFDNLDKLDIYNYSSFINKLINPICYLHNNNIVHLDIKLENYLINKKNDYILIDFNVSRYHTHKYYDLDILPHIVGTKQFIAPEVKELRFCKSSDIYSLGCLLYMVYTNTYYDNNIDYSKLKKCPNNIKEIIKNTLHKNHIYRPSIYDLKYYYKL